MGLLTKHQEVTTQINAPVDEPINPAEWKAVMDPVDTVRVVVRPTVRGRMATTVPLMRGRTVLSPSTVSVNGMDAGFVEVDGETPMRMFMQVQAKEKCGKTHLACSMPGPVAVISTDTGTEEVCRKFTKETGKRFFIRHVEVPREVKGRKLGDGGAKDYEPHWNQIEAAVEWVIGNKSIRSLFFDTVTEVWEIFRLARFGKLTQVSPQHYGPVNREMSDFFKRIYRERPDLNVMFVSKVKKEYKALKTKDDTAWNGKYERAGFGDLAYIARMNIELSYVPQRTETGADGVEVAIEPGRFAAHVLDCGENPDCIGLRLYSPDLDFVALALNVFPKSNELDWE